MSDPAKYRTKEELESYKQKDPIEMVRKAILKGKMATEDDLSAINQKIKERVLQAVKYAEESEYPNPEEAYHDVYAQTDYPFLEDK
jgi:pyruvate dehydrogenase E1 component alpha subunit